jgi:hypothetical protein
MTHVGARAGHETGVSREMLSSGKICSMGLHAWEVNSRLVGKKITSFTDPDD